ncbi:MAG: cadherin repeat domain-containing protein, partial [Desulfobulbaceae bacterium]|nr:cadherin repeat domain-containing protein [Desulfobulbaceae bacterium]
KKTKIAYEFFGIIKTAGFSSFEFREMDGKYGQEIPIFMDDFIIVTTAVTPTETNIAPVLATIGDRSIPEGEPLEFLLEASDSNPDDGRTFTSSALPAGATIVDNEDGTSTFSWTPDFTQSGIYSSLVFTVTDNGFPALSDSETITITVNDVNRFPNLTSSPETSVIEETAYSYTLTATDEDLADILVYTDVSSPAIGWLTFNP